MINSQPGIRYQLETLGRTQWQPYYYSIKFHPVTHLDLNIRTAEKERLRETERSLKILNPRGGSLLRRFFLFGNKTA